MNNNLIYSIACLTVIFSLLSCGNEEKPLTLGNHEFLRDFAGNVGIIDNESKFMVLVITGRKGVSSIPSFNKGLYKFQTISKDMHYETKIKVGHVIIYDIKNKIRLEIAFKKDLYKELLKEKNGLYCSFYAYY